MANPIERNIVSASELLGGDKQRVTVVGPLADHVPLDAEAVRRHPEGPPHGVSPARSFGVPQTSRHKKKTMRGLAVGLVRHMETLASYIHAEGER
jgi:hypothetical protein